MTNSRERSKFLFLLLVISVLFSKLSYVSPTIIGTGSSSHYAAALVEWVAPGHNILAAEHAEWMWIPFGFTKLFGSIEFALMLWKALLIGCSVFLIGLTIKRFSSSQNAVLGALMLGCNFSILYYAHTFDPIFVTLFAVTLILYLSSARSNYKHQLAALFAGLAISISLSTAIFCILVFLLGTTYSGYSSSLKSSETRRLAMLWILGVCSWLLLQVLFFGYRHLHLPTFGGSPMAIGAHPLTVHLLALVVTENILLFALLGRMRTTYEKGLIAAMLLFALSSPHELAIAVLPILIFILCIRFTESRWIGVSYLVLNLAAFFLLPAWSSDPQVWLPVERRSEFGNHIEWDYCLADALRGRNELVNQSQGELELRSLLAKSPVDSSILLIDPSSMYWCDEATVATSNRASNSTWYLGHPINVVRRPDLSDTEFVRPSLVSPHLIAIFDKGFARARIDSVFMSDTLGRGVRMLETDRLQSLDLSTEASRKALIDQLIYLHYHSYH